MFSFKNRSKVNEPEPEELELEESEAEEDVLEELELEEFEPESPQLEELEIEELKITSTADADNFIDGLEIINIEEHSVADAAYSVDLQLEDEPFEIGIDTIERMQDDELANAKPEQPSEDEDEASDEQVQTPANNNRFDTLDEVLDAFLHHHTKQFILVMSILTFLGSLLPFWSIHVDNLPSMVMGNLFNGYALQGALGKLFILAIIAVVVLVLINMKNWAFIINGAAWIFFVVQTLIIVFMGSKEYSVHFTCVRPGIGFIAVLASLLLILAGLLKNRRF